MQLTSRLSLALLLTLAVLTACVSSGNQNPPGPLPFAPRVSSSSPIAISADGQTVWVVNPDADTVTPLDTGTLETGAPFATGREPWGVAVTPAGTVVVLNRQDGSVSILEDGRRTDVPVGPEPGGLALSSDGSHAWVTVSGSAETVLLDLSAARVTERHTVGPQPWAIAVIPEAEGDTVVVTHRLARDRPGSMPNDSREGWLTVLRAGTRSETALPPHEFGFPNVLESIAVTGETIWLSHLLNSPELPNNFQTTVSGGVSAVDLASLAELPARRLNLNDPGFSTPTNFPRAIAATADGQLLLVVLAGTDAVMGIDISSPASARLAGFWPTGANPRGIVLSPDGQRAYVMSYLARAVSVLDLLDPGRLDSHVELARVPVTQETLDGELLRGQMLFNSARDPRMSRNGWMSCASCHPDGRADGTTWDLGEGPRQTMPLWTLAGTAPFHAAGTRDEVQDFEFDIENLLGGIGVVSIAAGIAFQTVLGNMFAGIVILTRDRYRVGDQISVGEHRGTVVEMGLTSTSVRTYDGRLVLIPNGTLHSEMVTVQTGFEHVRSSVLVDIADSTDLARAARVAVDAMRGQSQVLDEPAPEAFLTSVGTATVQLELRFWSGARQLETKEATHAVVIAVLAAFAEHGVEAGSDVVTIDSGPRVTRLLLGRDRDETGDPGSEHP